MPDSELALEATESPAKPKPTPSGDIYPWLYGVARTALWWLYSSVGGVTMKGTEHIPATGPAIIAPNHVSDVDPPLVAVTIRRRPVTIMAKDILFKPPVLGPLIRHLGAFPVKRGQADRTAIRTAVNILDNGRLLLLFPEGTRGDGINLQPAQRGLGLIAMKTGAPVIPALVYGTQKMLPKGGKFNRAKVGVMYAAPIYPSSFTGKNAEDDLGAAVMAKIGEMKAAYDAKEETA